MSWIKLLHRVLPADLMRSVLGVALAASDANVQLVQMADLFEICSRPSVVVFEMHSLFIRLRDLRDNVVSGDLHEPKAIVVNELPDSVGAILEPLGIA